KVKSRPFSASSSSLSSSTFMTGAPSALRQPLRFHPGIHLVTELMTYWLSHSTSRSSSTWAVARKSSSTAFSSPWLLVACFHPPASQHPSPTYQAQPAGPGFPSADRSAAAMIVMRQSYRRAPTSALRDDRQDARDELEIGVH